MTDDIGSKTIKLTWEYSGPCPWQWYACFYNSHDDKTYCAYIREDTYWWSASLMHADGRHPAEDFMQLPAEMIKWEEIQLAFDYLTDNVAGRDDVEMIFKLILEEIIIYLSHKFPYLRFDSQGRDNFDFNGVISSAADKYSCMEVLHRRAELMRKYLAEYDRYTDNKYNRIKSLFISLYKK